MKQNIAIKTLSALAHDGRLSLMRLLIRAGETGIGSGDLARQSGVGATTASAQLLILSNAGLVKSQRQGRSITYYANYNKLGNLLTFLMHDCCADRAEICCIVEQSLRKRA